MEKFVVLICYLVFFVQCQPQDDTPQTISLGSGVDLSEVEPIITEAQATFESLTQGLSVEEVVQDFPKIFNATIIESGESQIEIYGLTPIYEAVLRTEKGVEIITGVLENSDPILIDTFLILVNNVEPFLLDDPVLSYTNYMLTIAEPLLRDDFKQYAEDVLVAFILASIQNLNVAEVAPIALQAIQNSIDDLISEKSPLDQLGETIIAVAFQDGSETTTDEDALSNLLQSFLNNIQQSLNLEDQLFLSYLSQTVNATNQKLLANN